MDCALLSIPELVLFWFGETQTANTPGSHQICLYVHITHACVTQWPLAQSKIHI